MTPNLCTTCGCVRAQNAAGKCRTCVARAERDWVARHPDRVKAQKKKYEQANRAAHLAHRAVESAIRRGRLVRLPCESCGDPKSQGHHADYSKRLEVRWLCRPCHAAHHVADKLAAKSHAEERAHDRLAQPTERKAGCK